MHGSSFVKIVPISNIEIIRKGADLNFAMGRAGLKGRGARGNF